MYSKCSCMFGPIRKALHGLSVNITYWSYPSELQKIRTCFLDGTKGEMDNAMLLVISGNSTVTYQSGTIF